jgi:hypothetical protein
MISPAGAEGINLRNVRQVHILEPYWNEVRIEQVVGRAVRFLHHIDLPPDERIVDIYRYKMIRKSGKITSDEVLENLSRKKYNLLLSFTEAVKEAAVDCELFKNHNMMGTKYNCFQFNENSLFDKPINAAYYNSKDSILTQIKVRKIKAVEQYNNESFSEPKEYWLYDKTGVIYDIELNYPVGKLKKEIDDIFSTIDNNIYIVDEFIYIPKFKIRN